MDPLKQEEPHNELAPYSNTNILEKVNKIEKLNTYSIILLNSVQLVITVVLLGVVFFKHRSRDLFSLSILGTILIQSMLTGLFAALESYSKDEQVFLFDGLVRGSQNLGIAYHWIFAIQYLQTSFVFPYMAAQTNFDIEFDEFKRGQNDPNSDEIRFANINILR